MRKHVFLTLIGLLALTGCATTSSRDNTLLTQMQIRLGEMERQLEAKDSRIASLETDVKDLTYDLDRLKEKSVSEQRTTSKSSAASSASDDDRIIRVDVQPTTVQQALKNAGYYSGNIDGKVGSGTKAAISKFQQDNGIKVDGLVGKETWNILQQHL